MSGEAAVFDALCGRLMTAGQVPGLALAIVRGGHAVRAAGYGLRSTGTRQPVRAHTVV
jgi:beta-lactamase class C